MRIQQNSMVMDTTSSITEEAHNAYSARISKLEEIISFINENINSRYVDSKSKIENTVEAYTYKKNQRIQTTTTLEKIINEFRRSAPLHSEQKVELGGSQTKRIENRRGRKSTEKTSRTVEELITTLGKDLCLNAQSEKNRKFSRKSRDFAHSSCVFLLQQKKIKKATMLISTFREHSLLTFENLLEFSVGLLSILSDNQQLNLAKAESFLLLLISESIEVMDSQPESREDVLIHLKLVVTAYFLICAKDPLSLFHFLNTLEQSPFSENKISDQRVVWEWMIDLAIEVAIPMWSRKSLISCKQKEFCSQLLLNAAKGEGRALFSESDFWHIYLENKNTTEVFEPLTFSNEKEGLLQYFQTFKDLTYFKNRVVWNNFFKWICRIKDVNFKAIGEQNFEKLESIMMEAMGCETEMKRIVNLDSWVSFILKLNLPPLHRKKWMQLSEKILKKQEKIFLESFSKTHPDQNFSKEHMVHLSYLFSNFFQGLKSPKQKETILNNGFIWVINWLRQKDFNNSVKHVINNILTAIYKCSKDEFQNFVKMIMTAADSNIFPSFFYENLNIIFELCQKVFISKEFKSNMLELEKKFVSSQNDHTTKPIYVMNQEEWDDSTKLFGEKLSVLKTQEEKIKTDQEISCETEMKTDIHDVMLRADRCASKIMAIKAIQELNLKSSQEAILDLLFQFRRFHPEPHFCSYLCLKMATQPSQNSSVSKDKGLQLLKELWNIKDFQFLSRLDFTLLVEQIEAFFETEPQMLQEVQQILKQGTD